MKRLERIVLIVLLALLQLYLVAQVTLGPGPNLAKTSYRRAERMAALVALEREQSPENKAAFEQEMRLESRHYSAQQITLTAVIFVALLGGEAVLYFGVKRDSGGQAPLRSRAAP